MKLDDRVVCITGGGSGLGREMARLFADEGARVVVTDIDGDAARETVEDLKGDGHLSLAGDVSDSAAVGEWFAEIGRSFGRLDVLVNNAGVDRTAGDGMDALVRGEVQLTHMSDEGWTRMLEIHLNGSFFCTREALKLMLPARAGSIINLSSIAGLAGMGAAHYSTAKGGLLGLTRSLARDLGRFNIRVNAICPGAIDTPMTQAIDPKLMAGMVAITPLGRVGQAQEIARTALFLASDDSSFITGQWISPNGGIVMS